MLEQFYKYIVKSLMIGYFKKVANKRGDRYYVIMDDKGEEGSRPIDLFKKALAEESEEIIVSGIFPATQNIKEDDYETRVIKLPPPLAPIIVGNDADAREDYLVTMRNEIGKNGGKYQDYSLLFVLSECPHDASNPLSSICTSCKDLRGPRMPFSVDYVIEDIRSKEQNAFERDHERLYFDVYLTQIASRIEDGSSSLYDLIPALSALQSKSIEALFNELGFFPDFVVMDVQNHLPDEEIKKRAELNFENYQKISDIMGRDDEVDKVEYLLRLLDEKMAKKIAKLENGEWRTIDFQEILDSIERKNSTDSLTLEAVSLREEGFSSQLIYHTTPKKWQGKKRTKTYAIACDLSNSGLMHIKMLFNKKVSQKYIGGDSELEAQGKKVYVNAPLTYTKAHVVGVTDNRHEISAISVPCRPEFFKAIEDLFTINKKGEVCIQVAAGQGSISFGTSVDTIQVESGDILTYDESKSYKVKINEDAQEDYKIIFSMDFAEVTLKFNIDVKAEDDSVVDPIENPERRDMFSQWEDEFIKSRATRLVVDRNELQEKESVIPQNDILDLEVAEALKAIFDYYSTQKAGPTLLGLCQESKAFFEKYLAAVQKSISGIQNGAPLSKAQFNLTKLGVVECGGKVYWSSFHPLMVAYLLEYEKEKDSTADQYNATELLTPFYLAPFIRYNETAMRPCWDPGLKVYKNWLCYEPATSRPQDRAQDITTRMVFSRMQEFIKHFPYLFQDKDSPIIISTIGIEDDRNVIKGVLQFIMKEYPYGVQRIEIHEYIPNLMAETFFEKLNRLVSTDLIVKELEALGEKIDRKGEFTSQEIIHQLFSRVALYKHVISDEIMYCHIAFYQMDAGTNFTRYSMSMLRSELAFNGLVSIPSTTSLEGRYHIGFGMGGVDSNPGRLYTMARDFNSLYANAENDGTGAYQPDVCLSKSHVFDKSVLLNSIYNNANWVTFLNPEVDIDFFYKQKQLYVVHYTDQYSINAKYDSITVTRQVNQYHNLLKRAYEQHGLNPTKYATFNSIMERYFNCLNGNWLLGFVNKTESQVNEKMSLVAASIVIQKFMRRNDGVIWIPLSLDEILRVTGSIRLPKHFIFTKEDIGAKGPMSDDLLMMGLDARDEENLKLYLYPIEVKLSKNNSFSSKSGVQVSHTYQQLRENLFGEDNFIKKIFRTFFASQLLVNAEKLNANGLMEYGDYEVIEKCRYRLLNLRFNMVEELPVKEMGNAALVSFYSTATHSISTSTVEGANVCEIHFSAKECFEVVANPESSAADFLVRDPIDFANDEASVFDGVELQFSGDADSILENKNQSVVPALRSVEATQTQVAEDRSSVSENHEDASTLGIDEDFQPHVESTIFPIGIKIVLGTTALTHREIVFEPNNTKMVSHPNMGIIGTMGTGKTQFARSVITQIARQSEFNVDGSPVGVLVFDYKGDYKDSEFLQASRGACYKSNFPFNPLKLIQTPDLEGVNLPAVTADRISDSFAKAYGLGLRQQGNIKQVIIDTYADFGITRDPSTWGNQVPAMEDVIDKYFATYDSGDKAYVLFDKLRDYTIFTPNSNACVSIFEWLDKVQVIDLTLYPDDTKKVIVSLILDLFYAEMRQLGGSKQVDGFRQLRSFIMVDEAHQFLKKDFNSLRSIISEGRMFGVGMILSTQNLGDFKSSNEDYSQFILSWVIHHINSISKSEIASIFGATDTNAERYMDRINKAKLFESVCKIGGDVSAMRDLPFFELLRREDFNLIGNKQ